MNKKDFDRFLQVTAQCTKTFTRFRLGTADTEPVEKKRKGFYQKICVWNGGENRSMKNRSGNKIIKKKAREV